VPVDGPWQSWGPVDEGAASWGRLSGPVHAGREEGVMGMELAARPFIWTRGATGAMSRAGSTCELE
jgi:hypothetical protein